jgi:NAD(P)-dependent dehydrogenase (short-subunit alcohol dehydrogenase family)
MTGRLAGKVAVITGAGSGIGRATSILFASEGAKLVIGDKSDGVYATARAIEAAGGTVSAMLATKVMSKGSLARRARPMVAPMSHTQTPVFRAAFRVFSI